MIRKVFKQISSRRVQHFLQRFKVNTEFFGINRQLVSQVVMVGTFFALLPVPTQLLFVILMTALIRFNIIIAMSIVLLTNPLTMPFVIYAEYKLGSFLMQQEVNIQIQLSMGWISEHYALFLLPLLIGAAVAATSLSAVAYFLINRLWIVSVKKAYRSRKSIP